MTGAGVPTLIGAAPGSVVAFSRADGAWKQIPVQVDERAVVDLGPVFKNKSEGVTTLTYTDPGTLTGPDPDPALDADDEVVFMARDAGASTSAPAPAGVNGSGVEVEVTDPLDPGAVGSVYLFRSDSLDPGAGQQYVNYTFGLLSGDYKTTYRFGGSMSPPDGPNPENSFVITPHYKAHYSDRWIQDGMQVTTAGSSGVDILDRHKNLFAPGNCGRSEDTFSGRTSAPSEGAFIVNKSGPVRAIRAYIGANSGPYTQRTEVFYDRRQDIRTNLRVHVINQIMDFYDYSPDATGMTYRNLQNPGGLLIDGVPDPGFVTGPPLWEQVTGPQGGVSMVNSVDTDMNVTLSSYRLDDSTPTGQGQNQCTGDAFSYGAAGAYLTSGILNTDPRLPDPHRLVSERVVFYETPGVGQAEGELRMAQVGSPLQARVRTSPRKAETGLKLKLHRGKRIVLAGSVCGGEGKPSVRLERRTPKGNWARVRGLGLKAGKGDCFKLQTRLAKKKAIYRVTVAEESAREPATSRALKIKPAGK